MPAPHAAGNLAALPFESGNQTEIIKHWRPQQKREIANGFHGGFGGGFDARDLSLHQAVLGRNEFRQLAEVDKQRAERLTYFIM